MSESARAASELTRLMEIMATLRAPGGCPWDREQTIDTLKPFVLEETYEVLEAIDRHDHDALREELGDFVFEAVFLAQLEAEEGRFTIADSIAHVADKLVRRHPHVFARDRGEAALDSAGQVRQRWEEIKAQENAGAKTKPKTLLSGIAPALPALLRAYHIGTRAASVNFDWTKTDDVVEKIQEEVDEIRAEVAKGQSEGARVEEEMGDLLFSIAQLARQLGVEPETALRKANDKFTARFAAMEGAIAGSGRTLQAMTLEEMEREWQKVKRLQP
ncbi:MAG TPA: nucleoside triphosphate pyrophosphohydrolase [Vicinamibacterales bacterium]|nr:nucleoside triphosphate pyrophosphohydrolase [Vicinamibacterales bacterium]